MRNQGPWAVLAAILVVLGIKTLPSAPPAPSSEGKGDGSRLGSLARAEPDLGTPGPDVATSFCQPLLDFLGPRAASTDVSKGEGNPSNTIRDGLDREHWNLDFIIATVPDPIDSSSGYRFDSLIDAIQRAAETQNYFLDRYYYPWQRPGNGAKAEARHVPEPNGYAISRKAAASEPRELFRVTPLPGEPDQRPRRQREPGVLLFRKFNKWQRTDREPGDLLAVLLVGETATSGIHKLALRECLNVVAQVTPRREIRILGPYFSGSQSSLASTISAWERDRLATGAEDCEASRPRSDRMRILSGSATALQPSKFVAECCPAVVSLQATVIPERVVFDALLSHLGLLKRTEGEKFELTEDVAVLVETNTRFGQSFQSALREGKGYGGEGRAHGGKRLISLPFPTHISDVRTSYQRADGSPNGEQITLPAFESKLRIPLDEGAAAGDTEPSLHQAMSAVTSERILAAMLNTVHDERIGHVAIVASDVKDQIFLATLVRQYCPDARLLFTSGDVMLSHPDHNYYLKGALVGSTYPLYVKNQTWSFPFQGAAWRIIHPSQAEQGYYNAAVALLGPCDWTALLEYGSPFEKYGLGRPPVWISVVGQSGLQPLTTVPPCPGEDRQQYLTDVFGVAVRSGYPSPEFRPQNTTVWHVPFVVFTIFVAVVLWQYLKVLARPPADGQRPADRAPEKPWLLSLLARRRSRMQRRSQKYFAFACLTSLLTAYAYVGYICFLPILSRSVIEPEWWQYPWPWIVLAVAACFGLLRLLVLLTSPGDEETAVRRSRNCAPCREPGTPSLAFPARIALLACRWKTGLLSILLRQPLLCMAVLLPVVVASYWRYHHAYPSWLREHTSLLFFERATNLPNGVSPVTPIFFLGMGFFTWSTFHLKRLFLLDLQRVPFPFPCAREGRFRELLRCHLIAWRILVHPGRVMAGWGGVLVYGALLFTLCRLALRFVPTVEGPWFDSALLLGLAVYSLLIVNALLQSWALWRGLRKLLQEIARLPMRSAYNRIPLLVASQFGLYLASARPNRKSHQEVREQQRGRVLGALEVARLALDRLSPALDEDERRLLALATGRSPRDAADCPAASGAEQRERKLRTVGMACLVLLERCWQKLSVPEALGEPEQRAGQDKGGSGTVPAHAVPEGLFRAFRHLPKGQRGSLTQWTEAAEDFVALEVTNYLSQFFVHLRNLLTFLTVGSVLLLFALVSYPLQPQRPWLLFAGFLIVIIACMTFSVLVQIERDEVVSRISGTVPNKLNLHWQFIGGVLLHVVPPVLGVIAVASTNVSDLVHTVADPLLNVLR